MGLVSDFLTLDTGAYVSGVVLLVAAVALTWILPLLHGLLLSPTKKIPGPFWARVTRWWEYRRVMKGLSNLEYVDLHKKYGSVVRVGPNRYSFDDPEDIKIIYELGRSFPKSDYYSPLLVDDPDKQNIFTIKDQAVHKERRKNVSSLFTMSSMKSYEPPVDRMTTVCIRKLRQFADENRLFSLPKFMQFYAFDVIGEITFDKSFDMMEREGDTIGLIDPIHKLNDYLGEIGLVPDLHPWIARLSTLRGKPAISGPLVGYIVNEVQRNRETMAASSSEKKQYDTFMKKLLDLEAAHKVSFANMIDATGSNIGAGSDTTGISLSATLFYLYKNPECLARLRDEIDTKAAQGQVSDPITFEQAQSLPYLQAVLKETLRIHPAVGTILPRVVPKGGVQLAGTYFPEGSEVGANAWVVHANKGIYGQDAEVYRPERWLEPKENRSKWMDSMWMPFGLGSRTCIGKNISLLEINKAVPQLVRNFDFVFENKSKIMDTTCKWFVQPKYNVWVRIRGDTSA